MGIFIWILVILGAIRLAGWVMALIEYLVKDDGFIDRYIWRKR